MLLIRCSLIKIQGLSRTKMNEREFQGLSRPWKTTFKIQDANEPCHKEKLGSVKRIEQSNLLVFQILLPYHTATVSIIMYSM